MREIKFRYIYKSQTSGRIIKEIHTLYSIANSDPSPENPPIDYVLIARDEYTGLKDKNGKEIYEGDIVRFYFSADNIIAKSPEEDPNVTEMIDTVEFYNGAFYLICEFGGALVSRWNDRCEVIGNKFENPDLIKKEVLKKCSD